MAVVTPIAPLTRRVTGAYRDATPEQLAAGELWYPEAHAVAVAQATEYGVLTETAAGVLAAFSPRTGWGPNIMLAERFLATEGRLERYGTLGRSTNQARRIYEGESPDMVLRGPKTNAFFHAILTAGDTDTAVIDRHAWDLLVGQRGANPPTNRQYREADEKMQRAAAILGVKVSVVQATTWLVQRAKFWQPGAFDGGRPAFIEGAASW